MVVVMGTLRALLLERRQCLLRAGEIARLQRLADLGERLPERAVGIDLGAALGLRQRRIGLLRPGEIAGV